MNKVIISDRMKNIFVAAHPRSGSTFFCGLLHSIPELKVYFEIFHSNIDVIKSHLHGDYEAVNHFFYPSGGELSKQTILSCSEEYLQFLGEHNRDKRLVYKVFPGHLPQKQLNGVVSSSEVIVILHRNLLHSFISDSIATEMQRWASVDTSEKRTYFSPDKFISHVKKVIGFYDQIRELGNDKTIVEVNYETIIAAASPILEIQKIFETINLKFDVDERMAKNFKRQDKRVLAEDKVSNPEELMLFLRANKLEMLNDARNLLPKSFYSSLL